MTDRIVVDPSIHFGKPCVAGSRVPVHDVLDLVRDGRTFNEITQDYYPDLVAEDVRACIQYAIDVLAVEEIRVAPMP